MIAINTFSLIDLLTVVISTHVMLVFLYRSLRVTRRSIDLVFTLMMLLVTLSSFLVLASCLALWGFGGLVSIILAAVGYAGVDPAMLLGCVAMVCWRSDSPTKEQEYPG